MIGESIRKRFKNMFKRSALIKMIALEEMSRGLTLPEDYLKRASKECGILKSITRIDVNFQKEMLKNKALRDIIKRRDELLDDKETLEFRDIIIRLCDEQEHFLSNRCRRVAMYSNS